MKVLKKPLFRKQISEIYDRTANTWGVEQADRYIGNLLESIELASKKEKVWRKFNSFGKTLPRPVYSISCQKHFVFFEFMEEENTMIILAIFHQAMNLPDHLRNVIAITGDDFGNILE